jgi:DNA invertase Pin-like site-specific DNA recombinase
MTTSRAATTPRVANYARYSTDRQDTRSIEDQFRRCRVYAAEHGFDVAQEFSDAAASGSHTEREGLQRLLRGAEQHAFHAVLVDDLSRLSRDLGATWRIIFEELAALGVRVIDCSTNIASDAEGARLLFGVKALVNDEFLQNVRRQTHRGLEGRALAGFHTGGRTYGYSSVVEEQPPNAEHPRKIPTVQPDEAAVVVRIFQDYAAGMSARAIAAALNAENVPAPHDGGKGHKLVRGWGHTTIRAMLLNDRYIGLCRWNEYRWVRTPGKRTRRRLRRPDGEHIVATHPDLRIVPEPLWDAVRARLARRKVRTGRPHGTTQNKPSLLSGLLRCGLCGGSMCVRCTARREGRTYRSFACTTFSSRGSAICTNGRFYSEHQLETLTVRMLKHHLDNPAAIVRFVDEVRAHFETLGRTDTSRHDLEQQLAAQELRVKNATEAVVRTGWSAALTGALKAEEQKLAALQDRVGDHRARLRAVPSPETIRGYLRDLVTTLTTAPARARDVLARHIEPLTLSPTPDGGYRLDGKLNLAAAVLPHGGEKVLVNSCSGGVLLGLSSTSAFTAQGGSPGGAGHSATAP